MAAMRVRALAPIVVAILAVPIYADLRIVTKENFAGTETTRVEYFKGKKWRVESNQFLGYQIVDSDSKVSISVDPIKREYSVHTFSHPKQTEDTSQTIAIDIETRDTGEQRQMFGHTARRFITSEHRRSEYQDKPPSETVEITTDSWYLDVPYSLPNRGRAGTVAILSTSTNDRGRFSVPKIKITRKGPLPPGIAVWQKTGQQVLEVTEFSEAPLDPKLFESPEDFRRVIRPIRGEPLSWSDQVLLGWQQLQDWFAQQF